eukprot:CAMPEP_0179466252 /NCGR_PEP_ID=MMETSP0799-20121207/47604_1 /TAXON_ID=46947 /ORGANISM="Geminigera cryophila, Strain CCMP2564" /LENGTH=142 /DNA_ID=CAMNT_0021270921 /DNA_START=23 /DNA_END=448 /DNA_ORIENTATION=+
MSGTYEDVNNQANRQIMLDRYDIIKEHSRWALATPPFFNLVLIPYELITFTLRYDALSKKYQASSFWGLLDIYLSRNSDSVWKTDVGHTGEDRHHILRLMSFMERAKAAFLEAKEGEEAGQMMELQKKVEHLGRQLEKQSSH